MKRWMMFLSTLAIAFEPLASIGAEGRQPLHVLYLGNSKSPRAGQFIDFFKKHFVKVTMADREDFKPSAAKDVDVVVFDWSQSEGNLEKTSIPFGRLEDWPKPTVLLNHSGLLVAGHWQLIGGAG